MISRKHEPTLGAVAASNNTVTTLNTISVINVNKMKQPGIEGQHDTATCTMQHNTAMCTCMEMQHDGEIWLLCMICTD